MCKGRRTAKTGDTVARHRDMHAMNFEFDLPHSVHLENCEAHGDDDLLVRMHSGHTRKTRERDRFDRTP